jgi:hypothetical protein
MNLFNLDIHVSVIEDVIGGLQPLGHTVESHVMSAHWWALDKQRASRGTDAPPDGRIGYGCVNLRSWENMWWEPKPHDALTGIGKRYHAENPQLENYDGYVCCYPPAFALLYEKFSKHVIVNMPIRYETPYTNQPEGWRMLNKYLTEGVTSGKITVVGNSRYDAEYYQYFTGQPAIHISSLCEYIDRRAHKYSPSKPDFFAFGEHAGCREAARRVPGVRFVRDCYTGYNYPHREIPMCRGIVWIPYNCSIMSFFEHYWLNIPLFVPTRKFVIELWEQEFALSQITWHAPKWTGSNIPPADGQLRLPDPHTRNGVIEWLALYDFYNEDEFPHITYFDSWDDLARKLKTADLPSISKGMAEHNKLRKIKNTEKWAAVMQRVGATK